MQASKSIQKTIFKIGASIFSLILVFVICLIGYYYIKFPFNYKDNILKNANNYNLSPATVASVINAESSYNPEAISRVGAVGLMQILPSTATYIANKIGIKNFDISMLTDPEVNIEFGCYYLNYLNAKFNNVDTVLAAYNAGEGIVNKWLQNHEYSDDGITLKYIPYEETRIYIQKVKASQNVYKNKF